MKLWTAVWLAPVVVALWIAYLWAARFAREHKRAGSKSPSRLVAGLTLRLSAVAGGLVLWEGIALVVFFLVHTMNPPAEQLVSQLRKGMPLREARQRAVKLGFAWNVDETNIEHVICHTDGKGEQLCESFARAKSFGALFNSAACNILVKDQNVEDWWFYMD